VADRKKLQGVFRYRTIGATIVFFSCGSSLWETNENCHTLRALYTSARKAPAFL